MEKCYNLSWTPVEDTDGILEVDVHIRMKNDHNIKGEFVQEQVLMKLLAQNVRAAFRYYDARQNGIA